MLLNKYGFDNALVIIDRFNKAVWTVSYATNAIAYTAAQLYYKSLYQIFGLSEKIVSDKKPQFRADFTDKISKILGIR